MAFKGPSQRWPLHSRPRAREALQAARSAGWYFRECSGHTFGILKCSEADGACRVQVWSTSGTADGSDTAKAIRQAIRRCPHDAGAGPSSNVDQVDRRTDLEIEATVNRLIDAADALQRRLGAEAGMQRAADNDDDEEFDDQEAVFAESDNDAALAFHALGKPVHPWPPQVAIEELLREAASLASQASDLSLKEHLLELQSRKRS